jgi:cold shock CspA family protein
MNNNSTFLFLKPFEENENIFVEFWTTNGSEANALRSGSKVELYSGTDIRRDSIILMTNTIGGRNKIDNTELLTAYKNTLLSRGRVVTQQDIKNLCVEVMGNLVDKVEIKKGLTNSLLPGEGLMPTLDIYITPMENKTDDEEWLVLQRELESRLELNSVVFSRYRVFLS